MNIIAITGPAGSGKSTVGEKLAKKLGKCANIDADHIKHMIVSGFYKDETNPGGWGFSEWALAGDNIGLLAKNFQENGFDVVINGYIDESGWDSIQKHITFTHRFLLLPELETVKVRDQQRPGDEPMGEEMVTEHHDYFTNATYYQDFTRLDTTSHSIEETVQAIYKALS